jgi:hypothetical protein
MSTDTFTFSEAPGDDFTFENAADSQADHAPQPGRMVPHKAVALAVNAAQAAPDIVHWWNKLDNWLGGIGA